MTENVLKKDISPLAHPVGWISHELFYWHDSGAMAGILPLDEDIQPFAFMESPESKRRIESLLSVNGLLDKFHRITPRLATDEELLSVHTEAHVQHIKNLASIGGGGGGGGGKRVFMLQ